MHKDGEKVVRSEAEWRAQLTAEQYRYCARKPPSGLSPGPDPESRDGELPLRRMRGSAVHERRQIRLRLRLAELHASR